MFSITSFAMVEVVAVLILTGFTVEAKVCRGWPWRVDAGFRTAQLGPGGDLSDVYAMHEESYNGCTHITGNLVLAGLSKAHCLKGKRPDNCRNYL